MSLKAAWIVFGLKKHLRRRTVETYKQGDKLFDFGAACQSRFEQVVEHAFFGQAAHHDEPIERVAGAVDLKPAAWRTSQPRQSKIYVRRKRLVNTQFLSARGLARGAG